MVCKCFGEPAVVIRTGHIGRIRLVRFNMTIVKTPKELAFLRDLYVAPDWTQRFTDLFDANFKFSDDKEILYVNGGTGKHPLELREKLSVDSLLSAYSTDEESNVLAQAKADLLGAEIGFSDEFPRETYDLVIADASFVPPDDLPEFLEEVIDLTDSRATFFLPTAGSFGEIFSFLWESFLNADLLEKAIEIERLIMTIPTILRIESIAKGFGLSKLTTKTNSEVFEFENGTDFIRSPLVADFLLPAWLDFLDDDEIERVSKTLTRLIDDNAENLTFRFTVKATLFTGEKT